MSGTLRRLLLSPREIDFEEPVTIAVNGKPVWQGRLERDPRTLLAWASRDHDRSMLFAAELEIDLSKPKEAA